MLSLIRAAAATVSVAGRQTTTRLAFAAVSASSAAAAVPTRAYHARKGCYGFRVPPKATPEEEDAAVVENRIDNPNLLRLVSAYRAHGHKVATVDPLGAMAHSAPELNPSVYGFDVASTESMKLLGVVDFRDESASIAEVEKHLRSIYCGHIAFEFEHLPEAVERRWFAEQIEKRRWSGLSDERRVEISKLLSNSEVFDNFMQKRFVQVKRYGGEGAEAMMAGVDEILRAAAEFNIRDVVLCMPHRGRLNLLTDSLQLPPAVLFAKVKGIPEYPAEFKEVCSGDVLSHIHTSVDLQLPGAKNPLHVSMLPNPSHLEAVNPVALGKTRARQLSLQDGDYKNDPECKLGDKVMCLQLHGDAAFAAQGVVTESLGMANLPHYSVGGTVHMIVNNQLGFTTPSDRARSSRYCSDVGKMIDCPVIHVNGDHPEEVVRAARLAMEYRMKFRKDILIDLICYRRMGHNELDDPSMTQPVMYKNIRTHKSVPKMYEEQLIAENLLTREAADNVRTERWNFLDSESTRVETFVPENNHFQGKWKKMGPAPAAMNTYNTGVDLAALKEIGLRSVAYPPTLNIHPRLKKAHVEARIKRIEAGTGIDWATAEALAFGSLMLQKYNVRISGQDVGRGTFSQRHAMLIDQNDDSAHIPLNDLGKPQAFIELCNSDLSEFGVLGFEYGVSIDSPQTLTLWEAQFGDFFNGAQIIIDTFINSGEAKWLKQSGLVMLLPHGYDGAGPEHSSCRMERFLQLTDSDMYVRDTERVNMGVVNPTTPAQYFHLLRRQMVRPYRKPLIVVGPKTLLRLPAAVSDLNEMASNTSFQPVLGESHIEPSGVKRVIVCSGKLYYDLAKQRDDSKRTDVVIIRLEELCPFPAAAIESELAKFTNASEFVWVQEEQQNMGAWAFVAPRFEAQVGRKLKYIGRGPLAAPAVGVSKIHKAEVEKLMQDAFTA
ncbi:dehydrogenase E1 and transketolase domain-containing protein [Capsaspora owczarzaki ATCC 30864]|uniref:Dehydrogenase E1 and transketolase domain-containing protein n=1 Tax=Capsaspora owczarzaki (strain ATCC 30864) TaxID=595528 RepID=A0A0D2U8C4_CAPO3|nr:dehydrogenase E1 and transketolase domain-containing protein [Capsaspora owczarzaki ATCC 30864]KJE91351.1 dehydrogenase E1 and transketolase domain-containing protein [Capsaspora owczarzaki ATCC 30864]|eukprot:XP_004349245.2 dehydrogenase E1 and transketolase domain-containing protein [Capsaspora owczarzaki ATCC 30864]